MSKTNFKNLKSIVKSLKKNDIFIMEHHVSNEIMDWLTATCKKKGVKLKFNEGLYLYTIYTQKELEAERAEVHKNAEFWTDYFNSPG